jgi:pimeloyl-ACP methyl ester carboxylesterase
MLDAPEDRYLEAGSLRLHALAWPGDGAVLTLLVHATSFCAETWGPVWRSARRAGWRGSALSLDQRGHGRSDAPPRAEDYAWTELARDVQLVVEAIAADSPENGILLAGHSSGATACLAAAGARPELVRGLALVEPVLFDPPARPGEDSFAGSGALATNARKRRAGFESPAAARERWAARFPYGGFDSESLDACVAGGLERRQDGSAVLRCPPEREAWMYQGAAALDMWPAVEKIRSKALLVLGEYSAVAPELRDRLIEGLPQVRVERLPGATHFAALERPRELGALFAGFAAELGR